MELNSSMEGLMYIVPTEPVGEYKFLDPREVIWCELYEEFLEVWLQGREKYVINRHYKLFSELFSRSDFAKVSEVSLINIKAILDYDINKGIVELKDGTKIKVAPSERDTFFRSISLKIG